MKAAGELALESAVVDNDIIPVRNVVDRLDSIHDDDASIKTEEDETHVDIETYIPKLAKDRSWYLSELDLGMPIRCNGRHCFR